ncbi:hypothetical protein K227x_58250 [Rubripirellula lacrimiformis]|uniref:Uncharacterized protein n=1 Tax=Rubripirellula lacrimiformis TaxID=1930273 RepID=A0A517NJT6_9BACT|nr:hypothetical protein [Rubripirellula lacrimiformis]QDT07398.1 hypothetical protein K227x_58250 [Rubripirellula lacrimiformis]
MPSADFCSIDFCSIDFTLEHPDSFRILRCRETVDRASSRRSANQGASLTSDRPGKLRKQLGLRGSAIGFTGVEPQGSLAGRFTTGLLYRPSTINDIGSLANGQSVKMAHPAGIVHQRDCLGDDHDSLAARFDDLQAIAASRSPIAIPSRVPPTLILMRLRKRPSNPDATPEALHNTVQVLADLILHELNERHPQTPQTPH